MEARDQRDSWLPLSQLDPTTDCVRSALACNHHSWSIFDERRRCLTWPRLIRKLGFVGLGHMGGNMAARLLAAGYTVYGESGAARHAEPLLEEGLKWRDTPASGRRGR